jgi:hypothetical protein
MNDPSDIAVCLLQRLQRTHGVESDDMRRYALADAASARSGQACPCEPYGARSDPDDGLTDS